MPYIPQEQRRVIDPAVDVLVEAIKKATVYKGTMWRPQLPDGAMNYSICRIILKLLLPAMPKYIDIERAVGLMHCVDHEVYRKLAEAYEDLKEEQNGKVFEL